MKDYKPEIDTDTPLIDQNLKRETIVLLAILNLNYWCDTPEEKQEILDEVISFSLSIFPLFIFNTIITEKSSLRNS